MTMETRGLRVCFPADKKGQRENTTFVHAEVRYPRSSNNIALRHPFATGKSHPLPKGSERERGEERPTQKKRTAQASIPSSAKSLPEESPEE